MKKILISLLILIVSVITLFRVNPGNIFTPWLMKISRAAHPNSLSAQKGTKNIPYSTLFAVLEPKPVSARTVSKRITAKDGGTVKTTDAKGTIATLSIPAGALAEDVTISISPLQEIPVTNVSGVISNGVIIEPEGLHFLKNAQLTFEFKPMKSVSFVTTSVRLASNQDPAEILQNLTQSLNTLNAEVKKATAPVASSGGTKAAKNTLPKQAAIIHVDHQTGRIAVAESTRAIYGSKITTMIGSLSSFPLVDMGGPSGGALGQNDLQNGAAASGGACTPAFMNAMLRVASWQQGFGGSGGDATAMEAVQDCGRAALEEMEQRCQNDVVHVTRREMVGLIAMLQSLPDLQVQVNRAQQLMQECKRIYSVSADTDVPVPEGKSTYGISAQLCGYLDEQWVGTEISDYKLNVEDGWINHIYTGEIRFTLPHGGGPFQLATKGNALVTSHFPRIKIPDTVFYSEGDGQIGNYDGNKQMTIFYRLYGHKDIPLPIEVTKQQCESTNEAFDQIGF